MKWHLEILERDQKKVLGVLGGLMSQNNFYLGGGTAVALYLGHRGSEDLDWFTADEVPDVVRLIRSIRSEDIPFSTRNIDRGTLHGTIFSVNNSFFEYRYDLLDDPNEIPEYYLKLASLDDLACMKLSAIAQRGSKKDFIDLFALVKEHKSLERIITLFKRKYDISDLGHLLYGLSYFEDAEKEPMPLMFWESDWTDIKKSIGSSVKPLLEELDL